MLCSQCGHYGHLGCNCSTKPKQTPVVETATPKVAQDENLAVENLGLGTSVTAAGVKESEGISGSVTTNYEGVNGGSSIRNPIMGSG